MPKFEFTSDITGASYFSLMRELSVGAECFGFVVRDSAAMSDGLRAPTALNDGAKALIDGLGGDIMSDERCGSWPGTILVGHDARVIKLRPTGLVLEKILSVSCGFWDWMQPNLPEDLFIINHDVPVLTTIAHEHFGVVRINGPTETMRVLIRLNKMTLKQS